MNTKKKSIGVKVFVYFIPIIMIFSFLRMFGIDSRNYLDYPVYLVLGVSGVSMMFKYSKSKIPILFSIFLAYCLSTITAYMVNGTPIRCYLLSVQSVLLLMFFFYFGYKCGSDGSFDKMFMYGTSFCFLIGFVMHFTRPEFYTEFVTKQWLSAHDAQDYIGQDVLDIARFGSFFGNSYFISLFSIPTLVLSLSYINTHKYNNLLLYVIASASVIAAFLCIQRSAFAGVVIVLLFYLYYNLKGRKMMTLVWLFFVLLILAYIGLDVISSLDAFEGTSRQLLDMKDRMVFSEAISERSYQYEDFKRDTPFSLLFGLGLGSCGHTARFYGLQTINDNQYMLLLNEIGFLGCLILTIVLVNTFVRCFKYIKVYYPQLLIIGYFLFSFIGAEPLEVNYVSCIFWYSIGRVWNKDYYKVRQSELKL